MVRMVPGQAVIDGRKVCYAVSDNEDSNVWAVNLHGYLGGSSTYWRESANLAEQFGWRVLTPSLPAFGGSDPLPWAKLSLGGMAEMVASLMTRVGARKAVVLGHSMGGAVGLAFADAYPDRCLGLVYRDGAGTSSYKERPLLLPLAVAMDLVDVTRGKVASFLVRCAPDVRCTFRNPTGALAAGAMLIASDLSEAAYRLRSKHIPILPIWGKHDWITPSKTAEEFESLVWRRIVWVEGGHSWMLVRPGAQSRVLTETEDGQRFLRQVSLLQS